MAKKNTTKQTEKLVTIIMPVGAEAGKKVKVTEKQKEQIHNTFGAYVGDGAGTAIASDTAEVNALKKRIDVLDALQVDVLEAGLALDALIVEIGGEPLDEETSMVEKVAAFTKLLSSDEPGGGLEAGEDDDGLKVGGGDNG